jgi:hypothetical protein
LEGELIFLKAGDHNGMIFVQNPPSRFTEPSTKSHARPAARAAR